MRKKNKKNIILFLTINLLLLCFLSSAIINAEMKKPSFNPGQYWKYELQYFSEGQTYNGTSYFNVTDTEKMLLNNTEFTVFNCTETKTIKDLNYTVRNIIYVLPFNNSILKVKSEKTIQNNTNKTLTVFPGLGFNGISWPLKVGYSWINNETQITYFNNKSKNENISAKYECINTTELNLKAGVFDCYEVKRWNYNDDKNQNYTLYYYSSEAGGRYVQLKIFNNNQLVWLYKLSDYNYSKTSVEEKNNLSGGSADLFNTFIIMIIIMIIALSLMLIVIKKIR